MSGELEKLRDLRDALVGLRKQVAGGNAALEASHVLECIDDVLALGPRIEPKYDEESFRAAVDKAAREMTASLRKDHADTHRVLCERNSEISDLMREQRALVRALGEKEPK